MDVRPSGTRASRPPILVTGVPRSGTTWLARVLATADGVALAGREPMNPRGKQYALAHTLPGWARLERTSLRQRIALRTAYRGLNPWLYSRYGRRQWAAPLPGTRLVVKDPFAMLSVPIVVSATGARPVLLYRHPGAVLASYRRMGWQPDVEELRTLLGLPDPFAGDVEPDEATAMGWFWATLNAMALDDLATVPSALVVAHEDLASGGPLALSRLLDELGLVPTGATAAEYGAESAAVGPPAEGRQLHDFGRSPSAVASAWRAKLLPGELAAVEAATVDVRRRLAAARLDLSAAG